MGKAAIFIQFDGAPMDVVKTVLEGYLNDGTFCDGLEDAFYGSRWFVTHELEHGEGPEYSFEVTTVVVDDEISESR